MDWRDNDSALRRTASLIADGTPLEIVLEAIVRAVEHENPDILCSIMLLDDDRKRLVMGAAPSLPEAYCAAIEGIEIGPGVGACGTAAHINDRVIVTDIQTDPLFADFRDLAAEAGLGSCWSQPVRSQSRTVIGVFAMYHVGAATPTTRDITLIETAGEMAAIAIERQLTRDMLARTAACAQEAAEAEAQSARDLTAFFDASLDIMCVHDLNSIVLRIGRSVTDVLGYSPEEMIGESILRLVHPDDLEATLAARGGLRQDHDVVGFVVRMLHADGSYRHIEWQSRPHGDQVFAVGRDVTERLAMQAEMAAAREAAEAASRAKSTFLTTMSHEIRTPLNGILGMVQIMERDALPPQQQTLVNVIKRSGQSLMAVLDDILDLAKIEAGRVELSLERFDLDRLVRNKAAVYAPLAEAKGLDFALDIGPGARRHFVGDAGRLRRIFYTLLSNAVKFTESGEIRLAVDADADGRVKICVSDTGIGMTPEYQARMFESFQQAEGSLTRAYAGVGLGLAICHHSVALMGGSIAVDSRPGEGATFTLELPLAIADDRENHPDEAIPAHAVAPPTPRADARAVEAEPKVLKILVAEDHQVNRLVIRAMLEQLGIDPIIVEDGVHAVAAWEREDWDAILMDIQMPEMDGLTATLRIREREALTGRPRTPIVAVTANAMTHQTKAYMAAGMDGVVPKPIEITALAAALEAALDTAAAEPLKPVRTDAETILAMFASSQG